MTQPIVHPGRPRKLLIISDDERGELERLARRRKSAQQLALRARIVLACASGASNTEVAELLQVSLPTVGKWRERFRVDRLAGLSDEPRSGAPRVIDDERIERMIARTLESLPQGQTHWSRATMAAESGLSRSSVGRIWRAFGLKPHRVDSFKLSSDPHFIEKVRDVVGLYMSPPENAIVLCVDEKSQIQALDRTQPLLPMRPGQPERKTHDYERHGVTSLFAALDAHRGDVIWKMYRKHRQQEFVRFLATIDERIHRGTDVHLIIDNYATHKTPRVHRWLLRHPRFHLHFTPTYSSWLNLVERLFSEVTDKAIRRGAFRSVRELEAAIAAYLEARQRAPFVWTATPEAIFERLHEFCERTSGAGH